MSVSCTALRTTAMSNITSSSPVGGFRRSIRASSSSSSSSSSSLIQRRTVASLAANPTTVRRSRSITSSTAGPPLRLSPRRTPPLVSTIAKASGDNKAVVYTFDTAADTAAVAQASPTTTVVASEKTKKPPSSAADSAADAIVDGVLAAIAGTDVGRNATDAARDAVDANLEQLQALGQQQTPCALENPLIFGDYDVSYASTGKKQIGNPVGGRYRSGLGALLFRTVGIEQNLYEPNVVVNRVAFLIFGLVPGEVVLNGTFTAMTEELVDKQGAAGAVNNNKNGKNGEEGKTEEEEEIEGKSESTSGSGESGSSGGGDSGDGGVDDAAAVKGYGVDDGMTVRAFFAPPRLTVGGLPTLQFGPKSSVVLSTTYLDQRVRLGKGSRGSVFVFTRKSAEQGERDRKRWSVGGLAVTTLLACTVALFVFAVKRFRAGGVTELSVATAAAVLVSFAMALVMRQGGIIAEDADYDEAYEASAAAAAKRASGSD